MKRQVVKEFLNLPGITGIALIDGRTRPFFCGVDQALNSQQKETLAQGIHQVMLTTPPSLQSYAFKFNNYQVSIYKLNEGVILMVMTDQNLVTIDYIRALSLLQQTLQEDINSAVTNFRLIAGSTTLTGQRYWSSREDHGNPLPKPEIPSPEPIMANATDPAEPVWEEIVEALNQLSEFTGRYLGKIVVANYWQATCPQLEELVQLQVSRQGKISLPAGMAANQAVHAPQQDAIQVWVGDFMQRCSRVIRDYPNLVRSQALNPEQQTWLLK